MATRSLPGPDIDAEDGVISGKTFDGVFEDISEVLATDAAAFRDVLAELGESEGETKILMKAYKVQEGKGRNAWLFDFQPSELPILSRLRDEYNGGTFEIRVYVDGTLRKKSIVDVEAPRPIHFAPKKADGENTEIMRMMLEELRARNANPPNAKTTDIPALLTGAGTFVAAVTPAIKQIASAFRPAPTPPPENSLNMALEFMKTGMEFAKNSSAGGGESGEDNLFSMLKSAVNTFGPTIVEATKNMQRTPQGQPSQTQARATVADDGTQKAAPKQIQEQPGENDPMFGIKMQLQSLVKMAARNVDTYAYAQMIVDNMPEEQIKQFIASPDAMGTLIGLCPEVAAYPGWFESLRSDVVEILTPEGGEGHTSNIHTEPVKIDVNEQPEQPPQQGPDA